MKCPKCGSERIFNGGGKLIPLEVERGVGVACIPQLVCLDCKTNVNKYQQRLDNVLKHFEHRDEFYCDLYLSMDLCLYYDYGSKIFLLNDCAGIGLDTVESLLKDLGVMQ